MTGLDPGREGWIGIAHASVHGEAEQRDSYWRNKRAAALRCPDSRLCPRATATTQAQPPARSEFHLSPTQLRTVFSALRV